MFILLFTGPYESKYFLRRSGVSPPNLVAQTLDQKLRLDRDSPCFFHPRHVTFWALDAEATLAPENRCQVMDWLDWWAMEGAPNTVRSVLSGEFCGLHLFCEKPTTILSEHVTNKYFNLSTLFQLDQHVIDTMKVLQTTHGNHRVDVCEKSS